MNKRTVEGPVQNTKAAVLFVTGSGSADRVSAGRGSYSGAEYAAEALHAVEALRAEGVLSAVISCEEAAAGILPEGVKPEEALFAADSGRVLDLLLDRGLCAAAVRHAGNGDEDLHRAAYILEEPAEIDADSYQKIYERLKGLPWTLLTTKRCIIRELVPEDAPDLLALYDAEALRFTEGPAQNAEEEAKVLAAYAKKVYGFFGYGTWAVIDRESGMLIGRAGFEPFERADGAMSFGYILHPQYRGRGYAREACAAILRYGTDMLGFTAIEADTVPENAASVKLLERLGFTRTSTGDIHTYRYNVNTADSTGEEP